MTARLTHTLSTPLQSLFTWSRHQYTLTQPGRCRRYSFFLARFRLHLVLLDCLSTHWPDDDPA